MKRGGGRRMPPTDPPPRDRADPRHRSVVLARSAEPAGPHAGRARGTAVVSALTVAASLVLIALVAVVAVWAGGIILAPSGPPADHALGGLSDPPLQPPKPVAAGTAGTPARPDSRPAPPAGSDPGPHRAAASTHRPASHGTRPHCRPDLG